MPKKELQKHTLNLFPGDYERLQALFPEVGAGPIIRSIIRNFVEKSEAGEVDLPETEIDL